MGFGEAVRSGFAKYATFSGRASRSEYWWWWLFSVLVVGAAVVLIVLGRSSDGTSAIGAVGWVLYVVAVIGLIVPSLAVLVRRLHDTGRSGWWYFISSRALHRGHLAARAARGRGNGGSEPVRVTPWACEALP